MNQFVGKYVLIMVATTSFDKFLNSCFLVVSADMLDFEVREIFFSSLFSACSLSKPLPLVIFISTSIVHGLVFENCIMIFDTILSSSWLSKMTIYEAGCVPTPFLVSQKVILFSSYFIWFVFFLHIYNIYFSLNVNSLLGLSYSF